MSSENDSRKDPAWKYAIRDGSNIFAFKCNFCSKTLNGGVFRVKQHLAGGYRNVVACPKCPQPVRQEIKEYMAKKKEAKEQLNKVIDIDERVGDDDYDMDIDTDSQPLPSTQDSSSYISNKGKRPIMRKPTRKGAIDCYFTPDAETVVEMRRKTGKQPKIDENNASKKELAKRAYQKIARFVYDSGIPLSVVQNPSFAHMVQAIGDYGPDLPPPSYYQIRVPLLKDEKLHVQNMMRDHIVARETNGCTLMCDGWTDRRGRTLINFLVNCPRGSLFIESIDASSYAKDAMKLFELLDQKVEELGEANVVQIVTDSAAANKLAGKYLEQKRPHLFWSPCAAHCLDLMLEDIFKIPYLKRTWERAIRVHGYIYNRPTLLNLMRYFTQKKELLKPAKTRFATAFLTLQSFHLQKANLRKMFVSDDWTKSKWAKEAQGKMVAEIMMMPSFWSNVHLALRFASPLVHVLRIVDGEAKPAMGYIYEAMDRAKKNIADTFQGNESKYKEVFEIIDKRWSIQLHQPLHAAGYFLNPEFFYKDPDACLGNSTVYRGLYECIQRLVPSTDTQDQICNDLDKYRKADGLFGMPMAIRQRTTRAPADWWAAFGSETPDLMKFAIKILSLTCSSSGCERNWSVFEHIHSKKRCKTDHKRLNDLVFVKYNRTLQRRYLMRNTIDPIALSEIDESNEWLVGVPEEERVFDDDDLRWDDVAAAAGVEEPIRSTRSTYNRRPTTSKTSKASSSSRPSAFRIVDEEEEEEWEDLGGESDEGEEQDVDGYASEDDAQIDLSINDD